VNCGVVLISGPVRVTLRVRISLAWTMWSGGRRRPPPRRFSLRTTFSMRHEREPGEVRAQDMADLRRYAGRLRRRANKRGRMIG